MQYLKLIRWQNTLLMVVILLTIFVLPEGQLSSDQILYVVGVGLLFAGGNVINELYDVSVDRLNNKVNAVEQIGAKKSYVLYFLLNIASLILVADYESQAMFVIAIVTLWCYSFYLQKLPLLGNLVIAALTAVSIYWTTQLGVSYQRGLLFGIMCGVLQLIREIAKDLEDIKGDTQEGYRTLPISLGVNKTKVLLYILTSSFVLWLLYVDWWVETGRHIWPFYAVIYVLLVFMVKLYRAYHQSHFEFLPKILKMGMCFGLFSLFFF